MRFAVRSVCLLFPCRFLQWQHLRKLHPRKAVQADCVSDFADADSEDGYLPLQGAAIAFENSDGEQPLYGSAAETDTVPESYDLREQGIITSVKDQGSDGMCWAFATLGAAESHLLKYYETDLDNINDMDLSEEQVGYFLYTPDPQPLSPTYGDAIIQAKKGASGGNALHASFFLSTVGIQEEAYLPYQGCSGFHSEYQRKQAAYRMTGSETMLSVQTKSERETIKKRMMQNGGIYVAFHSSGANYYDNGTTYAYYQSDSSYYNANHAVLLIGWDDNYAKENFDPKEQPKIMVRGWQKTAGAMESWMMAISGFLMKIPVWASMQALPLNHEKIAEIFIIMMVQGIALRIRLILWQMFFGQKRRNAVPCGLLSD